MKTLFIALSILSVTVAKNCSEKKSSSENRTPDQYTSAEQNKGTTKPEEKPQTEPVTSTQAQQTQENKNPEVQTNDANISRLIASFYSIGEGTDRVTREEFEKFLESYSPKVAFDLKRWGREGETDYCLKLKELNASQKEDFVRKAKAILQKSKLVHIKENAPCRD